MAIFGMSDGPSIADIEETGEYDGTEFTTGYRIYDDVVLFYSGYKMGLVDRNDLRNRHLIPGDTMLLIWESGIECEISYGEWAKMIIRCEDGDFSEKDWEKEFWI